MVFKFLTQKKSDFLWVNYARLNVFVLSLSLIFSPTAIYAQTILNLPVPGAMVHPSPGFVPTVIQGITIHPENPLEFDFIIDPGDENLQGEFLINESNKLIKYFLASLTVPEKELWVNLSPYEKNRIIPDRFGQTEMGRDLLAQDYLLKQLTASLIYPENEVGKEFWDKVYKKAYKKFGVTDIPVNTFNKIWIVPDRAEIFENGQTAYLASSHLKVMLEEDYVALEQNRENDILGLDTLTVKEEDVISGVSADVVREVLIPEIEREINEGKTFANLRQIYHSMILATWYKMRMQDSFLGQVYVDQNKTKGIDVEDQAVSEKIYVQYLEAFKKGVYDYIREEYDQTIQEVVPRKYFSGGATTIDQTKIVSTDDFNRLSVEGQQNIIYRANSPISVKAGLLEVGPNAQLDLLEEDNNKKMLAEGTYFDLINKVDELGLKKSFSAFMIGAMISTVTNVHAADDHTLDYASFPVMTGHNLILDVGEVVGPLEVQNYIGVQVSDQLYWHDHSGNYSFPTRTSGSPDELMSGIQVRTHYSQRRGIVLSEDSFWDGADIRFDYTFTILGSEPEFFNDFTRFVEEGLSVFNESTESPDRFPEDHGGRRGQRLPTGFHIKRDGKTYWSAEPGDWSLGFGVSVNVKKEITENLSSTWGAGIQIESGLDHDNFVPNTSMFGGQLEYTFGEHKKWMAVGGLGLFVPLSRSYVGMMQERPQRTSINGSLRYTTDEGNLFSFDVLHAQSPYILPGSPIEENMTYFGFNFVIQLEKEQRRKFVQWTLGEGMTNEVVDWWFSGGYGWSSDLANDVPVLRAESLGKGVIQHPDPVDFGIHQFNPAFQRELKKQYQFKESENETLNVDTSLDFNEETLNQRKAKFEKKKNEKNLANEDSVIEEASSPIKSIDLKNDHNFIKGGIDFDPTHLDLQIKRDGNGVALPLIDQPINDLQIEGFIPIIISVTPIFNLPLLLGLVDVDQDQQFTQKYRKVDEKFRG